MKKLISALILASISLIANADCGGNACFGATIDELYPLNNGDIYVNPGFPITGLNCGANTGKYLKLLGSDPGAKAIYTTLLTAQATGRVVFLRIQDGSPDCQILSTALTKPQ
jgi:hypothetical protein